MKIIKNILFWATTAFLVFAIAAVLVPKIFGVEFRAVLTGSMEPEIPVGSLVVIVPTKSEDIQIGDDITFVSKSNKVVTHRVIEIDREKNTFTTYGIANGTSNKDAANQYENIIGVVRFHAPVIGRAFGWFATVTGKIISITAILAIYLITALLSILFEKKKDPEEPRKKDRSYTKGVGRQPSAPGQTTVMHIDSAADRKTESRKKEKRKPESTDEFWIGEDKK